MPGPADERAPQLRVSGEDRERAVVALRDAAADGRLTFDELAMRAAIVGRSEATTRRYRLPSSG